LYEGYICKALTAPGYWRIDGIGEINDVNSPRARIYYSQIHKDYVDNPFHKKSTIGESESFVRPVRALPLLTIGSIWHEGKRILRSKPISNSFLINAGKMKLVTLDEQLTLDGRTIKSILPPSHFSLDDKSRASLSKNARYALVPVLDNPKTQWLIVPYSELIRFYYGVSSRFFSSVISGDFERYMHWEKCELQYSHCTLFSKIPLDRVEVAVLARAICSKEASFAMHSTHRRLSSTQVSNTLAKQPHQPLVLETKFPFSDTTNLQIRGKRFLLDEGTNRTSDTWAVFAMELMSCTHSLGFRGLTVQHDESEPYIDYAQEGGGGNSPPHGRLDNSIANLPETDKRPNRDLQETLFVENEMRFVEFQRMRIHHQFPRKSYKKQKPSNYGVTATEMSFGESTTANDSKEVKGMSTGLNLTIPQRDISRFLEMLEQLQSLMNENISAVRNNFDFKRRLCHWRKQRICISHNGRETTVAKNRKWPRCASKTSCGGETSKSWQRSHLLFARDGTQT